MHVSHVCNSMVIRTYCTVIPFYPYISKIQYACACASSVNYTSRYTCSTYPSQHLHMCGVLGSVCVHIREEDCGEAAQAGATREGHRAAAQGHQPVEPAAPLESAATDARSGGEQVSPAGVVKVRSRSVCDRTYAQIVAAAKDGEL